MSQDTVHLKLKINFPVILFTVLLIHALTLGINGVPLFQLSSFLKDEPTTLKIRRVKTNEVKHPSIRSTEGVYNVGSSTQTTQKGNSKNPNKLSFSDLGMPKVSPDIRPSRPGSRPEIKTKTSKDMNRLSLKSKEFKDFSNSFPSGGLAISDMMAGTQKIRDAVVSIEVPDGIEPDELNEYELMFYGFQKRTAINFMNSIIKSVDKFQKTHPRYRLPNANRITMTARITYDKEGNVMQIKMIRWTHVNEMQGMFEDIVKGMDQLHNPPKDLWKKDGEFSMFYTLEILNG